MNNNEMKDAGIHGKRHGRKNGPLATQIHQTSTFTFATPQDAKDAFSGQNDLYVYSRIGNPNCAVIEERIAALEGGDKCLVFDSGMSAVRSATFTFVEPGDNIVACSTLYGCTVTLFNHWYKKYGVPVRYVSREYGNNEAEIEKLITASTKILYIETPANPTLDIIDIRLWARIADKHNCLLVVDNTFATPYLQRPLELGAHLVVHSLTKYLSGHGVIIGGAVIGSRDLMDEIHSHQKDFGGVLAPFNAWLCENGLKTFVLRMKDVCANAQKVFCFLDQMRAKGKITELYFPGDKTGPDYTIAKSQMKSGFGGMITFNLAGDYDTGVKFIEATADYLNLCVSLGDIETLIQHPASMTHAACNAREKQSAGITDTMIRLSIGCDNVDRVIASLKKAFKVV